MMTTRTSLYDRLRGMKVVVIDDDQWILNGLRIFFQYQGCDLMGFENAKMALDALSKERVDVIISDYWLPDLDGLTLFHHMKKHQPQALMVLITAYGTSGLREEAIRMGVDDFIEKPLTIEKLERSLRNMIPRMPSAVNGNA